TGAAATTSASPGCRRRPAARTAAARGRSSRRRGRPTSGWAGAGAGGGGDCSGALPGRRVVELAPVVLGLAGEDPVADTITARLAGEVVAFARVAIERLGLGGDGVDVVLG